MINFLKEKGFAVLLLSIIFTHGTLFRTSDIVNNQNDLSNVEFGWPMRFVSQDFAFSLTPPDSWFPREMGFSLPQEYPISLHFLPLVFDIAVNFLIIFSILFVILKLNPELRFLRKIISVKYILGVVALSFLLLASFMVFIEVRNKLQMGVGVPPPAIGLSNDIAPMQFIFQPRRL